MEEESSVHVTKDHVRAVKFCDYTVEGESIQSFMNKRSNFQENELVIRWGRKQNRIKKSNTV